MATIRYTPFLGTISKSILTKFSKIPNSAGGGSKGNADDSATLPVQCNPYGLNILTQKQFSSWESNETLYRYLPI